MEQIKIKYDFYEIFYNPYKELKTNHFHKFPKAKPSWSVEVKFEVFSKPWTGGGSACYAHQARDALGFIGPCKLARALRTYRAQCTG